MLINLIELRLPHAPMDAAPTPVGDVETRPWMPLSPIQVMRSTKCLLPQTRRAYAEEMADYALGLGAAVDKNRGLDHSKVREYWLQRGPRLLITALLFFSFVLVCQETLRRNPVQDRLYLYAVNTVGLLIAIWMLYFRLQDSIEASVARTAHDFYVEYKSRQKARPAADLDAASPKRPSDSANRLFLDASDGQRSDESSLSLEATVHGGVPTDANIIDIEAGIELGPVPSREAALGRKGWQEPHQCPLHQLDFAVVMAEPTVSAMDPGVDAPV